MREARPQRLNTIGFYLLAFSERQKCSDGGQISGCQGRGVGEGAMILTKLIYDSLIVMVIQISTCIKTYSNIHSDKVNLTVYSF